MGEALAAIDLSASFGTHKVLHHVSLQMPANCVTAIIGPPGSGKSTFIRCLNRLHETVPRATMSGTVLLGDEDVYRMDAITARQKIGMVFAQPNPFPTMSIFENVAMGIQLRDGKRQTYLSEEVERALVIANLWSEVKDRLKESSSKLSAGQQQRLCIARALALQPAVLLMDEPASVLDPFSTLRIEELIDELKDRYTIVIVTHNLQQAARVADRTAFFLAGEMIEQGTTTELFTTPNDKRTEDYVTGRFG
ncbi:phosphate ABC transporter ATP-binding protein [Sulfoacidibacillus thermotolerans]|uniref:Phosphate ABC transporter ATP-binding protein n=1 Tax=Sulfoacidibacillus thermotolerans TaxID=1765684 RepID=A0A2U3D9I0_SULT2|nr:phosphate ABC transporter ATP-binding protein [Sulfoacidibacillus thermotolerans]PWI57922.1 phosphate ABC transporter ATP-binding protein [Sulfoacidibacillus thermotolerans]